LRSARKKNKARVGALYKEKIMKWISAKVMPILAIVSIALGACSPLPATVITATPAPIVIPSATSLPPLSDDVWNRIMANDQIVVGVAWDYPPFAYIDPNFQVVGFDIALIQEIGRRLDIPVDIQNFTFEGLTGALALNQIDIAVAAISITPERAAQMSFSPVYYVNQTAILARKDSKLDITNLNQMVGYRIGVQSGTVYENLVQTLLIDTGLMSADKMLSYMHPDEAIRDLLENRTDLVLIGQASARYYSARMDVGIVGQGFEQQDLAIAMRLNTPKLKFEIDRVLDNMLTDGTMLRLIQTHIQSDILADGLPTRTPPNVATPTPLPPVATQPPPACLDGMKFVSDITYTDENMKKPVYVKPGEQFVKTWRVQNTGNCTWTTSYQLFYAYGNVTAAKMGGQTLNIPGTVLPGQMVDLSVTLVAPTEPLIYQGFWQIKNASNVRFGQTIWVGITTVKDSIVPVATGLPPLENYCVVTIIAPTTTLNVLSNFDAVWSVKNISNESWSLDSTDYKFMNGTAMHTTARYDFTKTLEPGESMEIIVDMVAPATPNIYNTTWAIVSGSQTLCILSLTVTTK
jgi:ABC-type amino acid transport substrate-binding protein